MLWRARRIRAVLLHGWRLSRSVCSAVSGGGIRDGRFLPAVEFAGARGFVVDTAHPPPEDKGTLSLLPGCAKASDGF